MQKEYKTTAELVDILRDRGLLFDEPDIARFYLETVGHQRLKNYYRAFVKKPREFDENVKIEDVIDLYVFDRRLRLLLLGPLEKIEVALRALIIKEIGDSSVNEKDNSAILLNLLDKIFYDLSTEKDKYQFNIIEGAIRSNSKRQWYFDQRLEIKGLTHKNKEARFNEHYAQMSAWEVIQYQTFGNLAQIFRVLRRELADGISSQLGLATPVLRSMLYSLRFLRNACAHHEPVWNWRREWSKMKFPRAYKDAAAIDEINVSQIYAYCAAIHILLSVLSRSQSTWYRRLKKLANEFGTVNTVAMGFPPDWQEMSFWCVPDVRHAARVERVRSRFLTPS